MKKRSNDEARLDALRAIDAFSECSTEELARIDSLMTPARIPAGRIIMTEGRPGLEFVAIQEGTATVTRAGRTLGVLGPGDIVGEMALIDEQLQARTATVTADTDITALVMNAGEFTSLLRESPSVRDKILRTKALRNHPSGKRTEASP